ncbi:class I SAM-dependent methyltransferase [Spongorhabdus nitratireducens]
MSFYDHNLADLYKTTGSAIDWRVWAEPWSLLNATGPVTGLNVLDAACGTGIITRLMARSGAASVTGIDISPEMLSEAQEDTSEPSIHYFEMGIEDYRATELHDLAVSSFLFNEALTIEQLRQFCLSLHRNLKPGGRIVTLMDMPDRVIDVDYSHYGFSFRQNRQMNEGDPFEIDYHIGSDCFTLQLNYYSPEFVQQTLENCGFRDVCMHPLGPSPEGLKAMPSGYWNTMICRPPLIIISAVNTRN